MYIHRYKIDNVLDVYRRQLSRTAVRKPRGSSSKVCMPVESVAISAQGKRQSIINRVSENIFRKIKDFNNIMPTEQNKKPEGAL